eukprot:g47477.t1
MSADACEDLEGNAKKRRKATKPSNTVTAQKRKKRILRASCKSVADDISPAANEDEGKPKPELPKENLYGDVEEGNLCSEAQKSSGV